MPLLYRFKQEVVRTTTTVTNVGASNSGLGTCTLNDGSTAGDVWFTFTTTERLIYTIEISNALPDVVMEILTGSCGTLNSVACESDGSITTVIDSGQTVFIKTWDSQNNDFGNFDICVFSEQPAANDVCADAIELTVQSNNCSTQTTATNANSFHAGEGFCTDGSGNTAGDVWFKFTATDNAFYTIETSSAGDLTDLVMEVFTGGCNLLTAIGCDDDGGAGSFSKFTTFATAGMDIFVRVWEFGGNSEGDFNICVFSEAIAEGQVGTVWEQLDIANPPAARVGHSFTNVDGQLLLFGGTDLEATLRRPLQAKARRTFIDLDDFDFVNGWRKVPNSNAPQSRKNHNTVAKGDEMFVFGGEDENTVLTNSILKWISSLGQWQTITLNGGTPPSPRKNAGITSNGNNIFITGGEDANGPVSDRAMHILNTNTNIFTQVPNILDEGDCIVGFEGALPTIDEAIISLGIVFEKIIDNIGQSLIKVAFGYNFQTGEKVMLETTGLNPEGGEGTEIIKLNDKAFLGLGGNPEGSQNTFLNNAWLLDLEEMKFIALPAMPFFGAGMKAVVATTEDAGTHTIYTIISFGGEIADPDPIVLQPEISNRTYSLRIAVPKPTGCVDNLNITDNPLASGEYQAANTIQTTGGVNINSGNEVIFKAGESITLNAGFHAKVGSDFTALIEACAATLIESESVAERRGQSAEGQATENNNDFSNDNQPALKAYPNPTHQLTTIELDLPKAAPVQLDLYDLNGRKVANLANHPNLVAGQHRFEWQCAQVTNGIYLIVLNGQPMEKLVVLK